MLENNAVDSASLISKVEELTRANAELLGKVKERNAEAKERRELIDSFESYTGVKVKNAVNSLKGLKDGLINLDELDKAERGNIERIKPILTDSESIFGKAVKNNSTPVNQQPKAENVNTIADSQDDITKKLALLEAENKALKLSQEFMSIGVKPDQINKVMKLWDEPAEPEKRADALNAFKADNPWAFADKQIQVNNPAIPTQPPINGSLNSIKQGTNEAFERASQSGDIMGMLKTLI